MYTTHWYYQTTKFPHVVYSIHINNFAQACGHFHRDYVPHTTSQVDPVRSKCLPSVYRPKCAERTRLEITRKTHSRPLRAYRQCLQEVKGKEI